MGGMLASFFPGLGVLGQIGGSLLGGIFGALFGTDEEEKGLAYHEVGLSRQDGRADDPSSRWS